MGGQPWNNQRNHWECAGGGGKEEKFARGPWWAIAIWGAGGISNSLAGISRTTLISSNNTYVWKYNVSFKFRGCACLWGSLLDFSSYSKYVKCVAFFGTYLFDFRAWLNMTTTLAQLVNSLHRQVFSCQTEGKKIKGYIWYSKSSAWVIDPIQAVKDVEMQDPSMVAKMNKANIKSQTLGLPLSLHFNIGIPFCEYIQLTVLTILHDWQDQFPEENSEQSPNSALAIQSTLVIQLSGMVSISASNKHKESFDEM